MFFRLLFLNTGNEHDVKFAKTQLDLVIEGTMDLKEFENRIREYMKRKRLQVQLCVMNGSTGWADEFQKLIL